MSKVLQRNNVNIFGAGKQVLVLAHGFGCDQRVWNSLIPYLVHDYRLVLIDHIGCGNSDLQAYSKEKYADLDGYANDILEVCQSLNISNAVFIGHSVSCMMGVLAHQAQPSYFSKLILIAPSPCYINSHGYKGGFSYEEVMMILDLLEKNLTQWAEVMVKNIMGKDADPRHRKDWLGSFCRMDKEIGKQFARVTFLNDSRDALSQVHLPTLIIQCAEDAIAPLTVGEFIHEKIAGSQLTIIDTPGHCPHITNVDQTAAAITNFLNLKFH